ncbi:spermidine/putrescine ABC transporter substrate-binding protein [Halobacteriales archaeon QS_5_70_15]|nr:MAG: spermidine/putrescine ABC transporter substrate-binding protein [Halobacteriales archaeon QS_5_70_15]
MPEPIDRRTILRTSGLALASAPLAGCVGGIGGGSGGGGGSDLEEPMDLTEEDFDDPTGYENTFNNWNWYDGFASYAQEQLPKDFEDLDTVNVSGYASPTEWYSKIQAGNHDIDNIGGTANFTYRSIQNDLLQAVPLDRMPNVQENVPDQYMSFVEEWFTDDEGNQYALPQSRGVNPALGYSQNVFDEPPSSWDVLWDDEYEGQIIIQDRPNVAVQIAARYTGQDWRDPDDFEDIKEALLQQKPLVKTYWTEYSSAMQQFINESAVVGTQTMGRLYSARFQNDAPHVNWTVPDEGSTFFADQFIIPTNAPHPIISAYYMNWAAAKGNAIKLFTTMGYLPAIGGVDSQLEKEGVSQEKRDFVNWQQKGGERLDFLAPLDDEVRERYSEIWTEVKAA